MIRVSFIDLWPLLSLEQNHLHFRLDGVAKTSISRRTQDRHFFLNTSLFSFHF